MINWDKEQYFSILFHLDGATKNLIRFNSPETNHSFLFPPIELSLVSKHYLCAE